MTQKQSGYILYYECPLRDRRTGEIVRTLMLHRSGACELEMAQALTTDLTKLKIKWEIRDAKTEAVIEHSNYKEVRSGC